MPQDSFIDGFHEGPLKGEREKDEEEDIVESEKCKVLADDND
ncbi:MAG: hypothetical protein ABH864_01155 [archaeon]